MEYKEVIKVDKTVNYTECENKRYLRICCRQTTFCY